MAHDVDDVERDQGGRARHRDHPDVADIGTVTTLTVRLAGEVELRIRTTDPGDLDVGDECSVGLPLPDLTLWPAEGP